MQTRDERRVANNVASQKYRKTHPKTDAQKRIAAQVCADWREERISTDPIAYKAWQVDKQLKYRYGLTFEQYDAKLKSQNGLCALCKQPFGNIGKRNRPHLDHDHATGELRDFLHNSCNAALGMLKDDPETCRLAAEYLERHKLEGL